MKTSVIKPGLLVSLKTALRGGVNYKRKDLEAEHVDELGARVARWETSREIPDPVEFERATAARSLARSKVAGVCCVSAFGLLCPSDKEAELAQAIIEAREVADAFNESAALSRVEVFVLVGRVAQDDAEAARAIGNEVRELVEAMQAGIRAADPVAIREAANKARAVGGMLSEDTGRKVEAAIEQARRVARELVKRVEKAGERAADVVASCNVQALEAARFAFLDTEAGEVEAMPQAGRTVELEGGADVQAGAVQAPALELS